MADHQDTILSSNDFMVVGIGASAGGLEAFKQLIKAIPVDSGMAFILVQHLDPSHESMLCELLQKITLIPVHEVTDNIEVEPDNIYVIPPNKLLTANDGILNLTNRPEKAYHGLPIDIFFNSLAEVHQSHAIGVVLSGTGNDGTLGLKAIKENGGITFAQHLHSANFSEMPQNAINAKVVDYVLPPEQIVLQLIEISKTVDSGSEKSAPKVEEPDHAAFKNILSLLEQLNGVDFTYYKQTTILRRIRRRVALKNFASIQDYLDYVKVTPSEVEALFNDILIPVTEFFRDSSSFDALVDSCLPALLKSKRPQESIRVWCVGCSTGQEAYSLAICLSEFLATRQEQYKLQIFATDISEIAIAKARTGMYSPSDIAMISPERLEKYFLKTDSAYTVNKSIRDHCVFATHNILTNPPFAGIDLISCRNVLIYMDAFLQRKAMATFHYALNGKGLLFLGKSESIGSSSDLFGTFSEHDKIYTKNPVPGRFTHISARRKADMNVATVTAPKEDRGRDDFQRSADEFILAHSPAGVIVNDQHEIVQFRGTTGEWLEAPPGKPSLNVLKMAKHGLSVDLRNALYKAKTTGRTFIKENIAIKLPSMKMFVSIEVTPLPNTISAYYLIRFRKTLEIPIAEKNSNGSSRKKENGHQVRAAELEKELLQTREDMRTITEDQEAGNEELLSANEELLSGSEELRSLNEELEISKEELQSTVEELSVANQELAFKNEQLNYSRKYAEAIVATIREPLIVLDREFRIKSANAAFYETTSLNARAVEGKYFYEIAHEQWNIPALRNEMEHVARDKNYHMNFELTASFPKIGDRIMQLNARKIGTEADEEHLILLAIEDITARKTLEETLIRNADYAKTVLDSSPHITATTSADGRVTYANSFFLRYTGSTTEDIIRSGWKAIVHPNHLKRVTTKWNAAITSGEEFSEEILLRRYDDTYCWHLVHALPIRGAEGEIVSWVYSGANVHEQKLFSQELEKQINERTKELKDSNTDLEHSNKNLEQFAFIASHDLQEPLRKIKTFTNILSENYTDILPAEGLKLVNKIHTSSDRMSSLIQDVLNFSRINVAESAFVQTDINKILENVLGDFTLLIDDKKATIRKEQFPVIEAIPLQINQLFYNLVSNSLKFTKPGRAPVITISSRTLSVVEVMKYPELSTGLDYFEILFADNGIGFNQKYEQKIFQIFQRLNSKEEYSGTGIGLALCKKIVLNHNGTIFGESHEDAGALFHIILPLNKRHSSIELLPGYDE